MEATLVFTTGKLFFVNGAVSDIESVTVPSGTYDTFKVQYTFNEDMPALTPLVTSSKTLWIDVQTGRCVKAEFSTHYLKDVSNPTVGNIQETVQLRSFQ
jgi:hypothetical protein